MTAARKHKNDNIMRAAKNDAALFFYSIQQILQIVKFPIKASDTMERTEIRSFDAYRSITLRN